ncbi:Putative regulatory protein associated with the ectoine operon [Salipiger mucosus DSM 16094]|uniref:Putative regulatory protein associated with the ectoine operon n=2 Tax=Salipiger mucosus TaxID=263378 RepID=S9QL59_9RHOB|nr:Putative regulatory protein associated with the ectoine operon [Salipiger mucosus DSM 16094]
MTDDLPQDRTDESLIALRRILRATEQYERTLAQQAGLTPAQLRVLQIIAGKRAGSATPKALATQMGVSQATVTALLDKLEKRQKIVRVRSEADRRQMNVLLTEVGHAAVEEAPDALQQRFVKQFEMLDDWEQAMLVASLERVASMLNAEEIDASPVLAFGDISRGEAAR